MNKKCNWAICFLRRFFLCLKLDSRVKITPFNNAVQHRWLHSPYCINSLKLTEKQTNKQTRFPRCGNGRCGQTALVRRGRRVSVGFPLVLLRLPCCLFHSVLVTD